MVCKCECVRFIFFSSLLHLSLFLPKCRFTAEQHTLLWHAHFFVLSLVFEFSVMIFFAMVNFEYISNDGFVWKISIFVQQEKYFNLKWKEKEKLIKSNEYKWQWLTVSVTMPCFVRMDTYWHFNQIIFNSELSSVQIENCSFWHSDFLTFQIVFQYFLISKCT